MSDGDLIKLIGGVLATLLTAAIIGLSKFLYGVDKRVSRIEWQLTAQATDASKALRNPHAANDRLKELLKGYEERRLQRQDLLELVKQLEDLKSSPETTRENKTLVSLVLRDIERKYTL